MAGSWPEAEVWRQPRKGPWRISRAVLRAVLASLASISIGAAVGWHFYHAWQLEKKALYYSMSLDLAIASWSIDQSAPDGERLPFDSFPSRAELILGEEMPDFYPNVLAGEEGSPMRSVPVTQASPGDFSYVPRRLLMRLEDGSEVQAFGAYALLVWGRRRHPRAIDGTDSEILRQRKELPLLFVGEGVEYKRGPLPDHYLGLKVEAIELQTLDEALIEAGLTPDQSP